MAGQREVVDLWIRVALFPNTAWIPELKPVGPVVSVRVPLAEPARPSAIGIDLSREVFCELVLVTDPPPARLCVADGVSRVAEFCMDRVRQRFAVGDPRQVDFFRSGEGKEEGEEPGYNHDGRHG